MPQLKTYIVEDSPVIRESLIATLEELVPVKVIGTAEDENTAVQWLTAPQNHADLVIVGRGRSQGLLSGLWSRLYSLIQEAPCPVISI